MLVLIFLVLLSALIIGFFTSVEGEVVASKTYQNSVTAAQLVRSATNIVAGQIVDGTRSTKTRRGPSAAGRIPAGERLAWASQPGLIRTWDDRGNGWKIFKLYSARDMVVDFDRGNRYSVLEKLPKEVPGAWPGQPAIYTDLNEPVLVEDSTGKIERDGHRMRASYPIVDPLAMSLDKVEGFLITTPPGYGGKFSAGMPQIDASTDPTAAADQDHTANPAPMPVVWIYVLKDGTLTVPNDVADGGRTAVWKKQAASVTPSRDNPIAGRIAFWTDDETCKLNINTSSEPTAWDTPRALTKRDLDYGKFQPAQREYQRYPGHPFTNALSPVLLHGIDLNPAIKEEIYRIIPRVGTGGTMGGSLSLANAQNPIVLDRDRLFANADELLFEPKIDPARPGHRLAISNDRTDLPTLRPLLTPERLRRARFFLTANSRAPETNLFGQPRVSLWPVNVDTARRTAHDKLAAFCSSIPDGTGVSTRAYYFQRYDPNSPANDFSNPRLRRNQELYRYLQSLTEMEVPGFGGNFKAKLAADRDQVLTEIFDYIRCTNLNDPQPAATPYAPNGQVAPIRIASNTPGNPWTKGFGRFHTISQAGLHFICSFDPTPPATGNPLPGRQVGANERVIEAAFIFTPFSPSVGWPPLHENLSIQAIFPPPASNEFRVVDSHNVPQPLTFPTARATLNDSLGTGVYLDGRNKGGAGGLRGTIAGLGGQNYPWISQRLVVSANSPLSFHGGTVALKLYCGASLVQTINVRIPDGDFPVPALVRTGTTPARGTGATQASDWWSLSKRYANARLAPFLPSQPEFTSITRCWPADDSGRLPGFKAGSLFRAEDVVRSVVPKHGDLRLIAGQFDVPATDWQEAADDDGQPWASRTMRFSHLFTEPAGTQFSYGFINEPGNGAGPGLYGSRAGDQLTPANYHYSRLPEIRPGAGRFNQWGDFDNGPAQTVDGAYINKPDEGNAAGTAGHPYWSSSFTAPTDIYFSPNRLVPSAGMLGSLPTGIRRGRPWQTLLFHRDPAHPGAASPPDHLLMDLFWMPVVEPYAISEPFSTAGKVNLNYEIAPFNYIHRASAGVGAMKSEEPLAIPTSDSASPRAGWPDAAKIYKLWDCEVADEGWLPDSHCTDPQVQQDWTAASNGDPPFHRMRKQIDPLKTLLKQVELDHFAAGQIFKSASEICDLHLVRYGELDDGFTPELIITDADAQNFWKSHVVTGDNTRERPYANLYGKLTTRSNTFTVHVRAQVLRQRGPAGGGRWTEWREGHDQRVAEYRGSTLLERYIDPADRTLPDFVTPTSTASAVVDNAYRTRIIATRKFTP